MTSALVTGASRGIGRAIAHRFAERGFGLTISARSVSDLAEVADQLVETGAPEVVVAPADLADRAAVASLVPAHAKAFGNMDVLVLNAGVGTAGPVETLAMSRFDKTVEVNLAAAYQLIQQSMPLLKRAAAGDPGRGARIVGISSITGAYAEANLAAYGASKAALLSLLETVNAEVATAGVLATGIAPGFVDTEMSAWNHDVIPQEAMIPASDIVEVVDMLTRLSANSVISRVVVSRSQGSLYSA